MKYPMIQYILRRLFLMIPTLFGITLIVFIIVQSAPGGPIEQAMLEISEGQSSVNSGAMTLSDSVLQSLKEQYHFDQPIHIRYYLWLKDLFSLKLGNSLVYERPVLEVISSKFPVSLQFGLVSLLLTYLFCIPLGIAKAVKDKSRFDYISSMLLFITHSTPGFVLGILLLVFFGGGSFFNWFPLGGLTSDHYESLSLTGKIIDRLHHALLPILCYMVSHIAMTTLMMKNALLEELNKDYIKTAKAQGWSPKKIIYKYALRNALIPIATGIGNHFSILFAGSLLIETVFNLDGIGLLTYTSILKRDYTVIMASVSIHSVLILLGNLASDLMLVWVDPRIHFE